MLTIIALIIIFILLQKSVKETYLPIYTYLSGSSNRLYTLLEVVKDLFLKEQIPFVITARTLLNAVTIGKLTGGEQTATILVPDTYISQLFNLQDELLTYGLGINDLPDGTLRLSSSINLKDLNGTAIHIFPVAQAGSKWITKSKLAGLDEWYGVSELFPTKPYNLGKLNLPGPSDPLPYLERNYWSQGHSRGPQPTQIIVRRPVREVHGLFKDSSKKWILTNGNTRPLMVPKVGIARPIPRRTRWRDYLWV